jgi:hypothetical protein
LYNGFDPPAGVTPITRDEFAGDAEMAEESGNVSQRHSSTWAEFLNKVERTEEAKAHPENYHY